MKKKEKNTLTAIAYIIIGILCCIFKAELLNWLMTIVGIVFVVLGVLELTKKHTTNGIINLVIGLVALIGGWLFVEILLIVLGVIAIIRGAQSYTKAGKSNTIGKVIAILTIVFGIMLIVSKWVMLDWMFILIGIVIVIDGVLALSGK